MQKLDVIIGRMRLLLADVTAREEQLNQLRRQYNAQTEKLLSFTIYGDAALDTTLTMMGDVQDRLDQADRTVKHLLVVRRRLEVELESLQLTRRIESLKTELAELQARVSQLPGADSDPSDVVPSEELQQRIRDLQHEINEASERAARTIGPRSGR